VKSLDFSTPAAKKRKTEENGASILKEVNRVELDEDFVLLLADEPSSVATHILPMPIQEKPSLPTMIKLMQRTYEEGMCAGEVLQKLASTIDQHFVRRVELETRGQSENSLWFEQRLGRLTASKFGVASRCKGEGQYIVQPIMGKRSGVRTQAMQYGLEHETATCQLYVEQHLSAHVKGECIESGLHLSTHNLRYAASPENVQMLRKGITRN
jgi:hypothetical protein